MYLGVRTVSSCCCIDPFTTIFVALKSILSDTRIATPAFYLFIYLFMLSIRLVNLSPPLRFESLYILACETGMDVTCCWVLAVSFDWEFSQFKFRVTAI